MSKGINIRMQRRSMVVLIVLVFVGFPMLVFRLVNLQIFQGEYLQKMAMEQQLTDTKINPRRGSIYDRNMNILAQSASVGLLSILLLVSITLGTSLKIMKFL